MITIEDVERASRALTESTEFTPEDRAAELEKQARRIDELAAKCGPGAEQVIIDIHAETEQYLADHPEARDLLTRKKQHTAQYAMRIALANSTFWQLPASTEESTLELTPKQKKENEKLLKDARKKIAAEIGEKKTAYKINQEETKRYEGVKSVYEIKQRAQADYFMRVAWRETLKDAEEDVIPQLHSCEYPAAAAETPNTTHTEGK